MNNVRIRNAIISCYDKKGLREFAAELIKLNPKIKIFSSSGTYRELEPIAKKNLIEISEYTGFNEMPSGLVKTLHPKIHSGILADVNDKSQLQYLQKNGIKTFDLVVVNLYPFENARRNIDVGGVSLIEAAVKNFVRVTVITSGSDYGYLLQKLKNSNGNTDMQTRLELAKKAVKHINNYLAAISDYFENLNPEDVK